MAKPEASALLQLSSTRVNRGGRTVLHDLSLRIDAGGGPFAIIGESGSGKTTLLLCATGLLQPDLGEVLVLGERLETLSPRARAGRVGLVFQDFQLFPHLSVRENIELAPRLAGRTGFESRTTELLESLRIPTLGDRRPHELSGGQKQRVAIARSLILEPSILFLDEPSAALDEKTTRELADLLQELNNRVQIVVVSHDRAFVEACCEQGVRMSDGRIGPVLPVRELMEEES